MTQREWKPVLDTLGRAPGMLTGKTTYTRISTFLEGFSWAKNDGLMEAFHRWLVDLPPHNGVGRSVGWSHLILDEVFPGRSEDSLSYPQEDKQAIAHLYSRIQEFLTSDAARPEWRQLAEDGSSQQHDGKEPGGNR